MAKASNDPYNPSAGTGLVNNAKFFDALVFYIFANGIYQQQINDTQIDNNSICDIILSLDKRLDKIEKQQNDILDILKNK